MAFLHTHTQPSLIWHWLFSTSVWLIYTLDHLIDAFQTKEKSNSLRHYFHFIFRKQLAVILGLLFIINFLLSIIYIEKKILLFGIILTAISLFYFSLLVLMKKRSTVFFQKELFIALIYTAGVWGTGLCLSKQPIAVSTWLSIVAYVLLVWASGLIFANFEIKTDQASQYISTPQFLGEKRTKILIYSILSASILFSLSLLFFQSPLNLKTAGILLAMAVLILGLQVFPLFYRKNFRYRKLGEAIFWLPFLLML